MQNQQSTVMVCIATGQTLPNLIPILIKKPDVVVILATVDMENKAHQLEKCIKQDVASCKVEILTGTPDSLLSDILDYGKQTSDYLKTRYPNDTITLNATGGTKLIFIGLVNSMGDVFDDMIYVDTDNGRIEFLPKDNVQKLPELLPSVLTTRQYLAAQGFYIDSISSESEDVLAGVEKRKKITSRLAKNANGFDKYGLITALNKSMYGTFDENNLKKTSTTLQLECPEGEDENKFKNVLELWHQTLELANELNIIGWDKSSAILSWKDLETAKYLAGIWLEEYVYLEAKRLELTDVAMSVKAYKKSLNEYDILITHNNKILVIECKTANLHSKSPTRNLMVEKKKKANEIAYKLDSTSEKIIGIYGDTWLVSSGYADLIHSRAADLKFRVIERGDISKISEKIAKWANLPPPLKMQTTEDNTDTPKGSLQAALKNIQINQA